MKNSTIILGIVILVTLGGYFVFANSQNEEVTLNGNVANNIEGVQNFVLSVKDANYYPNEIKVKADQPVSITLDSSVSGCLRSFTIKGLGVSKYARTPSETIDFTPTKKGTFRFACSMGMGYGNIVVE
ncbi:MAG TPA: cupredoxin domain-containing protein [Candidatus Nanoarchaeia archaeon]|nr:cupredoxin domain-containing protein [Candidatus Nanoarchaeia archaeon]